MLIDGVFTFVQFIYMTKWGTKQQKPKKKNTLSVVDLSSNKCYLY